MNNSSYSYWNNQPLSNIVESLRPNGINRNPLNVDSNNGLIRDGNTRAYILQENGININLLPRGE